MNNLRFRSLNGLALLALATAVSPALASAQISADEVAIRKVARDFQVGWNHHDAAAMAATFAADGDLINPFGRQAKGREGIEKLFSEEQSTAMAGTTYVVRAIEIRILAPEVAVSDWSAEVRGMHDPAGKELPPFVHRVFVVFQKSDGDWHAGVVRAFAPLAPPATSEASKD